jgi:hypothetical protein
MIAEVHDLANAEASYVRKYGLKCRTIPVDIRDRSKLHLALPFGMPDDVLCAGSYKSSGSL